MMKQYIFKLLWVAVPALIFCVFSSWVLYKGGELKTLDRVVEEMAEARKQGIVIGALDNLFKGAAGQAVQNMNIIMGIEETTGIDYVPIFPA